MGSYFLQKVNKWLIQFMCWHNMKYSGKTPTDLSGTYYEIYTCTKCGWQHLKKIN